MYKGLMVNFNGLQYGTWISKSLGASPLSGWLLVGMLFIANAATAQRISIYFPHFAGQEWDFLLPQGDGQDTILSGRMPESDTLFIDWPAAYSGYRGMGRWMLRKGGGVDMVLNGEDFQIVCPDEQPTEERITFEGSVENRFLREHHRRQQRLRDRYLVMQAALQLYGPDEPLASVFSAEAAALAQTYAKLQDTLRQSPLYAARFLEIVQFTRGQGTALGQREEVLAQEAATFLEKEMDWMDLYTSNHWSGVIYSWVQLHTQLLQTDSLLHQGALQILDRTASPEAFTSFCELLARYLTKFGKEEVLQQLSDAMMQSDRLLRTPEYLLKANQVAVGAEVPALLGADGRPLAWNAEEGRLKLLVFYQSTCGPCEIMLQQLMANYDAIRQAGVEVITISADTDRLTFEDTASAFPWEQQLFDGQGFNGDNFVNYGITGTPTLFVADASGRLLRRAVDLPSLLLWLDARQEK